jgi:hypothetical protein
MSIAKRILIVLAVTALVLQLPGCGQQRPAGGGTQQQGGSGSQQQQGNGESDTAEDTTTRPQDTVSDTAQ